MRWALEASDTSWPGRGGRGSRRSCRSGAIADRGDVAEPGAWMPEQIVDPGPFLSRLATQGLKVEFPDTLG